MKINYYQIGWLSCWLFWLGSLQAQLPAHLPYGHAHNDYDKAWPALHTALQKGFRSIEVDVYPYKGQLKVAHWPFALGKAPTLEELYLKPLDSLYQAHSPWLSIQNPLILMIDIKGQGPLAQQLLDSLCQQYSHLFSFFDNKKHQAGVVQLLLSGQYDWAHSLQFSPHYWQLDGRWQHLEETNQWFPRISQPYKASFAWKGMGTMPLKEQQLLKELVKKAHEAGKKLRFWGAPNHKKLWKMLQEAGVDWIQVDDLEAYEQFCKEQQQ